MRPLAGKYKMIACKVLMREMYLLASGARSATDIVLLRQQLHNTPDLLRQMVQREIDRAEEEETEYDAILLGYCLCSNGIVGLTSRKYPLVVARGHDCITLLLGSRQKYHDTFFGRDGGIYWYSPGWIEHTLQPGRERYEATYGEYIEKYGEDNARYLMEAEQGWMKKYDHAIYVAWPSLWNDAHAAYTRDCAAYLGWAYEEYRGDDSLVRRLLERDWSEEDFLVVPPGKTIEPSYDERIIRIRP